MGRVRAFFAIMLRDRSPQPKFRLKGAKTTKRQCNYYLNEVDCILYAIETHFGASHRFTFSTKQKNSSLAYTTALKVKTLWQEISHIQQKQAGLFKLPN